MSERHSTSALDLNEAAGRLGVHYQTAYQWVRTGQLPAVLVGGRYEIDPAAIDKVRRSRRRPARSSRPSRPRIERHVEGMHEALVGGDESRARRIVQTLVDEGAPIAEVIEGVLVPPLRRIGQAWHDGDIAIWVEHRASGIVDRVLGDVVPNPRGRRRATVMVGAVSGDRHSLPTTMAAVALRDANYMVHHLGADLPADDLYEFAVDHDVDLAVLSSTNSATRDDAEALADRLRGAGIRTLVGRPGATLGELLDDVDEERSRPLAV